MGVNVCVGMISSSPNDDENSRANVRWYYRAELHFIVRVLLVSIEIECKYNIKYVKFN